MNQTLGQELRLRQHLTISPQLQMAIRLLQLPREELVEYLKTELESNPVLDDEEWGGDGIEEEDAPLLTDFNQDIERYAYRQKASRLDSNENIIEKTCAVKQSLAEYLIRQIGMLDLSEGQKDIAAYIIGNIDDDGYLRVLEKVTGDEDEYLKKTVEEVSRATAAPTLEVDYVLKRIQQLDPPGIAARNLKECLMNQAKLLPVRDAILEVLISRHLKDLERGRYKEISSHLKVPVELILQAARLMTSLNPRPGRIYDQNYVHIIVPDAYVYKLGDGYRVVLNDDGMPKLRINRYYHALIEGKNSGTDSARVYVKERLRSAMWLIKSIDQRQRTIHRVVENIVELQREFLDKGAQYLRPMTLKDVASGIGVHESTVSRAIANKYVHTPLGTFELRYFFSTSINRGDGTDVSAQWIKEEVKRIIANEDPKRPLSDESIGGRLRKKGILISRRTITKYREAMGIIPSSKRRRHL